MASPAVLLADEVHRALIAFINDRYPDMPPIVLLSASSYLLSGMAAEVIKAGGRQLGPRELEAVLENVFDTMRVQVRAHLNGLPTRS